MLTKSRQFSVTDQSNNAGSMHLIQYTVRGPDDKDCYAWTSIKLRKRISSFCAASGFEECKTSRSSNNADLMSFFCAESNEQYGQLDNIRIFGVEDINDEVVYERVLEVANYMGVRISKRDSSVCHRLPSRNSESRPKVAKLAQRGTKFRVMTHKRNLKS